MITFVEQRQFGLIPLSSLGFDYRNRIIIKMKKIILHIFKMAASLLKFVFVVAGLFFRATASEEKKVTIEETQKKINNDMKRALDEGKGKYEYGYYDDQ
jgi:hypothetical protein